MTDTVLVTGAFGLVGAATVRHLAGSGRRVAATDLDVPANRKAAEALDPARVEVRWADLTDPAAVQALLQAVRPAAIIHLAAIIPPFCYARRALARKVNVEATGHLLRAAAALPAPPRFVLASSIAVYGARNPYRVSEPLTADTPVNPCDIYGAHKVEAETLVRESGLDWLILRLGGVLPGEPRFDLDRDFLTFEAVLPSDGRIHTVDTRDVAAAFAAATTVPETRQVLLIAGDDSHRHVYGEVSAALTAAMGLPGVLPAGRRGDPDSADGWFHTDWIDAEPAQKILGHQRHSWSAMLADISAGVGWRRYPLRLVAPLAGLYLHRQSPYRGYPGSYADPWGAIRRIWGDPSPDRKE